MIVELLAGTSFALAAWQDWKSRKVDDWVWLPAALALIVSFVFETRILPFLVSWSVFSFLLFLLKRVRILKIGDADIIAIALLASFPFANFFVLVVANTLSMIYLLRNGGGAMKPAPFCTFLGLGFFAILGAGIWRL